MPNRDKLPMIRDKPLDPATKAEMIRCLRREGGFTLRAISKLKVDLSVPPNLADMRPQRLAANRPLAYLTPLRRPVHE